MPKVTRVDGIEKEKLKEKLVYIFNLFEINEDGKAHLVGDNIFQFELEIFTLIKQTAKLFPKVTDTQISSLLQKAFIELANKPKEVQTYDNYFDLLNQYLNHEGAQEVQVVIFLNVHLNRNLPNEFTVAGTAFTREDFSEFWQNLRQQEELLHQIKQLNPHLDFLSHLQRFSVYSYKMQIPLYQVSQTFSHAINEVVVPSERLRALLNFNHYRGRRTYRRTIFREPLARYLPSPYYLIRVEEQLETQFFYNPVKQDYKVFSSIPPQEWDDFIKLEKQIYFQTPLIDQSLPRLVDNLLLIYQKALDAFEPSITFLHFWQVLERLASPEQEGRGLETNKIIARLKTILPLSPSERNALKELGELRHAFVHSGEFPDGNGEQWNRLLKVFVDETLNRLIGNLNSFPNIADLLGYYDVAVNPQKSRLSALENAIKYFREVRHSD